VKFHKKYFIGRRQGVEPTFSMIHYLPVSILYIKEECNMKTALQILKCAGKVSAKVIIWLADKLEGGK
jgi:hypothetical protein